MPADDVLDTRAGKTTGSPSKLPAKSPPPAPTRKRGRPPKKKPELEDEAPTNTPPLQAQPLLEPESKPDPDSVSENPDPDFDPDMYDTDPNDLLEYAEMMRPFEEVDSEDCSFEEGEDESDDDEEVRSSKGRSKTSKSARKRTPRAALEPVPPRAKRPTTVVTTRTTEPPSPPPPPPPPQASLSTFNLERPVMATHPLLTELLPPSLSAQVRGVLDARRSMSHPSFLIHTFGSSRTDLRVYSENQARWGSQVLWPTRGLSDPVSPLASGQGMGRTGHYSDNHVRAEARSSGWSTDRGDLFAARQRTTVVSATAGAEFLPSRMESQRVILGPADRPRLFDVPAGGTIDMAEAWEVPPAATNSTKTRGPLKHGWIINVGAPVQCLEWVPNVPGHQQFLAVAGTDRAGSDKLDKPYAPAFVGHPPSSASMQIWAFAEARADTKVKAEADDPTHAFTGQLDRSIPPRLDAVLCFPWGPIRQARWCPVATGRGLGLASDGTVDLGLLAGLFSDGVVRILRIQYRPQTSTDGDGPVFVRFESSAVEIVPENTVASTVTWLSAESIAVGFANGCVGVWNVRAALASTQSSPSSPPLSPARPRPVILLPVCSTYVLSITCLHPHPHLIAVSSMSGFVHVIDLSSPDADHVTTPRTRLISRPLAFHQLEQCILTVDENYAIRAHPVRRIHNQIFVGRLGAVANDIATSPVQPTVLVAGQDGIVAAMVMAGRLAGLRRAGRVGGIWFVYQWRRPRTTPDSQSQAPHLQTGIPDLDDRPLSRFVDGFAPEIVSSATLAPQSGRAHAVPPGPKKRRRQSTRVDDNDDDAGTDDGDDNNNDGADGDIGNGHGGGNGQDDGGFSGQTSAVPHTSATNSGSFVFNRAGSAVFSTIYEPDAAVNRVAWHPGGWAGDGVVGDTFSDGGNQNGDVIRSADMGVNARTSERPRTHPDRAEMLRRAARFGGWAAAGTGSGLVRVEDLSVD